MAISNHEQVGKAPLSANHIYVNGRRHWYSTQPSVPLPPRIHRNTLVFLAPDRFRLEELDRAVRAYLAWKSV